jgi:hypothetical protein
MSVRYQHEVFTLKAMVIGWAVRNTKSHTRAQSAAFMALSYLDIAADLAGSRRTHFLRCARDQWRVAVHLTGG